MPIDAVYQAMAFEQAVGILREGERSGEYVRGYTTSRTLSEVARRLLDNNRHVEGATTQAYRAVAQRALQSLNAVDAIVNEPSAALGRDTVPVSPTNRAGTDRFIYKTIVHIDDGAGGNRSAVNYITSDTPLSLDDVERNVRDRIGGVESGSTASQAAFALLGSGGKVTGVSLVSVQRTR